MNVMMLNLEFYAQQILRTCCFTPLQIVYKNTALRRVRKSAQHLVPSCPSVCTDETNRRMRGSLPRECLVAYIGANNTGWGSLRWDSKIWPWVLRDFHLRVTALARSRSNCTVIYRPVLSSDRALQNYKTRNCLKEISRRKKNWSQVSDGRLTVGRKLTATVGCRQELVRRLLFFMSNIICPQVL
jgi:hypothetical protein